MKNRSRGRKGDLEAREEWTARLNKFAAARSPKQKQAAIEAELKINPGGALRDMLHAWGYSASARGRKSHEAMARQGDAPRKTARERLEETLDDLFGKKPSPIPSLYTKLAGRKDVTVTDACRLVSAMIMTWPEPLRMAGGAKSGDAADKVTAQAEAFVRELLSEVSDERSYEWTASDMDIRGFSLVDEERVGMRHFIKSASENRGALIVSGTRKIILGSDPIDTIRQFHDVTSDFTSKNTEGILIFVFDAAIFEAGREGYDLIYNIGLFSSALTAFALFPDNYDFRYPVEEHKVDWNRWVSLCSRCCAVVRRPTVVDPASGDLLKQKQIDDFVASWQPEQEFEPLKDLKGFIRFESSHVLPETYPPGFVEWYDYQEADLYWDVRVNPDKREPEGLQVSYFVPNPRIFETTKFEPKENQDDRASGSRRGRRSATLLPVEEDFLYVVKRQSPGVRYDDAQRAIYMAARGRLRLDTGTQHEKNLNAAAALRQTGFEVLPINILMSLLPRSLHFAAILS